MATLPEKTGVTASGIRLTAVITDQLKIMSEIPAKTADPDTESLPESATTEPEIIDTITATRVASPSSIQKSKTTHKHNLAANYVNIIIRHDNSLTTEPWYELWQSWIEEDILEDVTLQMASVIIDLPPTTEKSHKSVSILILCKIHPLQKYMMIPGNTREMYPLLYTNRPVIRRNSPNKIKNKNNIFMLQPMVHSWSLSF